MKKIILGLLLLLLGLRPLLATPRVSIITSVFDGDLYIEGFLEDIVQQTIFDQCELLLINANSPGNEEPIINRYCEKYSNIIYKKLEQDPGIYGVWNMGILMASADLVTNANLDDRRNPTNLEEQALYLEQNPTVDLVYGDYLLTHHPNETFESNKYIYTVVVEEFRPQLMYKCLPGPQPMWRKSMHTKAGFFREDFKYSGDLEMWNRAVSSGSIFKKLPGQTGLYYYNPEGLSTNTSQIKVKKREEEDAYISRAYTWLWNSADARPIQKKWSILICTLDEREVTFKRLYDKLQKQIIDNDLQHDIEILSFGDNREHSIGFKRNALMVNSCGEYISFIDDDDDVHDDYIMMIYQALKTNPDCVKLVGIMTTRGQNPQKFVHSIEYQERYEYVNGIYIRPPNHLNPIKRSIACRFLFPDKNFSEDYDWAMTIAKSHLLKKEAIIDEPYYFYFYDGKYDQVQTSKPDNNQEPLYFCTAANDCYYDCLLNLIGSIHTVNYEQLGQIAVFDIGLNSEQRAELATIAKVKVYEVEKVHPDILKPVCVNKYGKMVPGWYAWKGVAVKQALEMFPSVLWIDAATTVLKPVDEIFNHIHTNGYFLTTIGNECDAGVFRHPVRWQTTQHIVKKFNLTSEENEKILDLEAIGSNIFGCTRQYSHLFVDDMYELAKDLTNFADDGTTPYGFGTARHDQMILTALAYTKKLTIFRQDYTQQEPIALLTAREAPLFITWHKGYICDKTTIYSSRGDLSNKAFYLSNIKKLRDIERAI